MTETNKLQELQKKIEGYQRLIKESNVWIKELAKVSQKYSHIPYITDMVKDLIKIEKQRQEDFYKWKINEARVELLSFQA